MFEHQDSALKNRTSDRKNIIIRKKHLLQNKHFKK